VELYLSEVIKGRVVCRFLQRRAEEHPWPARA